MLNVTLEKLQQDILDSDFAQLGGSQKYVFRFLDIKLN